LISRKAVGRYADGATTDGQALTRDQGGYSSGRAVGLVAECVELPAVTQGATLAEVPEAYRPSVCTSTARTWPPWDSLAAAASGDSRREDRRFLGLFGLRSSSAQQPLQNSSVATKPRRGTV